MTVGEVIRLLKQYPEKSEVKIQDNGNPISIYHITHYDVGYEEDWNIPVMVGDSCGL